MKICPTAPQAAKPKSAGKTAGLRAMKARAVGSSLVGLRGAGRRGERKR